MTGMSMSRDELNDAIAHAIGAIARGDCEHAKMLMECDEVAHVMAGAPIKEAASRGDLHVIKSLVECGLRIHENKEALHSAIVHGHAQVVRLLLEAGIKPDVTAAQAALHSSEEMKQIVSEALTVEDEYDVTEYCCVQ